MDKNLQATYFLDCDNPQLIEYAQQVTEGANSDIEKAVKLYYAVRDDIRYNPYNVDMSREGMRASKALADKEAFCIPKALLLTACARAVGIPAKLAFADVRNHLNSDRLKEAMGGETVFVFHGISMMYLNGKWTKSTPAFNKALCDKTNVHALDYDGTEDSLFHAFDKSGNKHMEYIKDRGEFTEFPYEDFLKALIEHYEGVVDLKQLMKGAEGFSADDFEKEAYAN